MSFRVICPDPPWRYDQYRDTKHGAAKSHYGTMSDADIAALPVGDLASEDAYLFLWVTGPVLCEGRHKPIMEAWGFEVVTIPFVWVKTYHDGKPYCGLGRYTRSATEFVVLGRRGRFWRESASVYQVVTAPVGKHSEKPQEVYDRIVKFCGDVPRVELFARKRREGWTSHGDECPGWVLSLQHEEEPIAEAAADG